MKNRSYFAVVLWAILFLVTSLTSTAKVVQGTIYPSKTETIRSLMESQVGNVRVRCPAAVHSSSIDRLTRQSWSYRGRTTRRGDVVLDDLYPVNSIAKMDAEIATRGGKKAKVFSKPSPRPVVAKPRAGSGNRSSTPAVPAVSAPPVPPAPPADLVEITELKERMKEMIKKVDTAGLENLELKKELEGEDGKSGLRKKYTDLEAERDGLRKAVAALTEDRDKSQRRVNELEEAAKQKALPVVAPSPPSQPLPDVTPTQSWWYKWQWVVYSVVVFLIVIFIVMRMRRR